MNVVPLAACAPAPWRNGGGSTRQLLAWPHADDWLLRVSVATIEHDGAFSAFAGHERWFAVLDGRGVVLSLPQGDVSLTPDSPALRFDGGAAPHCRLLGGATQDLNLMLRQDGGSGGMRRATPGSRAEPVAGWRGLYTADALTLQVDGAFMPVPAGTLLWLGGALAVGWTVRHDAPSAAARAWWMHWMPR